jgi:Oxidoreductase family, NAD-binding Rossmann fold
VTLRVGIVGCGAVARHHVPALKLARGVRLVAAFDLDRGAAARTGARVADSLAELIDAADLVAVCTPPQTHADIAVEALEAGRGVLVEKPLATTLADADRIVAAAAGRLAAIGFQLRCHRKLPRRAESVHGTWGGPTAATVGPLLDRAVHHVDLWRRLMDDEVEEAQAVPTGGGVRLEAVMRGGARPYVDLPADGPARNEIVADGRRIDLYAMHGILDRVLHPRELGRGGPYQSAFVAQWQAIARGEPPACVLDGRRALEIVLGA